MLVGANDGRVDEDLAKTSLSAKRGKYPMPHTRSRPAREALVRTVPQTELRWQIAPRAARARNPQNRLDEQAVVRPTAAAVSDLAGQQSFDLLPLVISKLPSHRTSNLFNRLEAYCHLKCQQTLNVQGLGFLQAQSYKVAVTPVSVLVGIASTVNAIFGGHPAIVARTGVAMLAAKEAGPAEARYWGVVVSALLTLFIAFAGTSIAALVGVLPKSYIFALAGLAILGALQDSLEKSFAGPLRFGALVAFLIAVTPFAVLGISSAFWALLAGLAASVLLERQELLKQWLA